MFLNGDTVGLICTGFVRRALKSRTKCAKEMEPMGVPWWFSGLRIWRCHCCGLGHCCGTCSISGLGISACCRSGQKNKYIYKRNRALWTQASAWGRQGWGCVAPWLLPGPPAMSLGRPSWPMECSQGQAVLCCVRAWTAASSIHKQRWFWFTVLYLSA